VELENIGQVKLIISKKKQKEAVNYYISTIYRAFSEGNTPIYEDRWNIETGHRESNQQLGFKEYQMHSKKKAIERFIQAVFSVWTVLLLLEMEDPDGNAKKNNKRNDRQNQNIRNISPHNRRFRLFKPTTT
jgi:DNA topoisomerase VI subunit B